jgi:hypothetical protein
MQQQQSALQHLPPLTGEQRASQRPQDAHQCHLAPGHAAGSAQALRLVHGAVGSKVNLQVNF